MKLSSIQYDVIMQAINNAKAELADGTFIDPYSDNEYSEKQIEQALNDVENIIIDTNIPW